MRIKEDLSKNWLFAFGEKVKLSDHADSIAVDVPHTWNAFDGQDGGNEYYRGKGT